MLVFGRAYSIFSHNKNICSKYTIYFFLLQRKKVTVARCYAIMYKKFLKRPVVHPTGGRLPGKRRDSMPETDKEEPGNAMPIIACVTVGDFQENCYLYACPQTHHAVIIDPGDE